MSGHLGPKNAPVWGKGAGRKVPGGPERDRTACLRHAMAALYQVSYGPVEDRVYCVVPVDPNPA